MQNAMDWHAYADPFSQPPTDPGLLLQVESLRNDLSRAEEFNRQLLMSNTDLRFQLSKKEAALDHTDRAFGDLLARNDSHWSSVELLASLLDQAPGSASKLGGGSADFLEKEKLKELNEQLRQTISRNEQHSKTASDDCRKYYTQLEKLQSERQRQDKGLETHQNTLYAQSIQLQQLGRQLEDCHQRNRELETLRKQKDALAAQTKDDSKQLFKLAAAPLNKRACNSKE